MVKWENFLLNLSNTLLGITIVVSPLLSLVEDQVYALRNLNIDARSLNSSTPRKEQTEIMHILDGKMKDDSTLKILYLTPGMLSKIKRTNQLKLYFFLFRKNCEK